MAHFAEVIDGVVTRVIVVNNNELLVDGIEVEQKGLEFVASLFEGTWIQTSYNNNFRKNFAFVGGTYDSVRNEFVLPSPFPSWTLDSNNDWQAPNPQPEGDFYWDESSLSWLPIPDAG
jgi:hypothetical protein